MPNPLPPSDLTLDLAGMRALANADNALGRLDSLLRFLPPEVVSDPHILIAPFVRREAVLSSRIEGTQTTVEDLYKYEASLPTDDDDHLKADHQEVANYVRALEYGLRRLDTLPVSLRLIREIHEILLTSVRGQERAPGEFRRIPVAIGRPGESFANARYVPPVGQAMMQALEALEGYIHRGESYPVLIDLALTHYQFEAIHPFLDGNGRTGRILIAILLQERGKLKQPLLNMSAYLERHRDEYVELLLRVTQQGAWLAWVTFFLRGVESQATQSLRRSERLLELHWHYHETVLPERASTTLAALVNLLFTKPILTIGDVAEDLDVTRRTASNAIQRLVELGILEEITGYRRNQVFAARELIRAIEEPMDEAE